MATAFFWPTRTTSRFPRVAGVEEVALQHGVVLGQDGDHDGRVFGALALVNRRGICRHQGVELDERAPLEQRVSRTREAMRAGVPSRCGCGELAERSDIPAGIAVVTYSST
jgi:hypothetical protein